MTESGVLLIIGVILGGAIGYFIGKVSGYKECLAWIRQENERSGDPNG